MKGTPVSLRVVHGLYIEHCFAQLTMNVCEPPPLPANSLVVYNDYVCRVGCHNASRWARYSVFQGHLLVFLTAPCSPASKTAQAHRLFRSSMATTKKSLIGHCVCKPYGFTVPRNGKAGIEYRWQPCLGPVRERIA